MKSIAWSIIIIIALITIIAPIIYFFFPNNNINLNDLMSGIFSTGLALIAGIPIALGIDRIIKSGDNKKQLKENNKKEKAILDLVKEELDWNKNRIENKRKLEGFDPLKFEYWDALKSSGDLTYISDPKLLNRITSAYFVIKNVELLEREANLDWTLLNRVCNVDSKWKTLWEKSKKFHSLLIKSIDEANKIINERKNKL